MTTLYRDPRNDYLIIHSTVDPLTLGRWKQQIEQYIENDEKQEKGFWNHVKEFIEGYIDSSFAEPSTLYHRIQFPQADLVSLFPADKKPVSDYLISYRRYELTDEKPLTQKGLPFSLSRCVLGSDDYPHDGYRLSHVVDQNPIRRYREYTALFCIQRDEGLQGGTLLFYPRYDEESTFESTLSDLMTQCALPRKELEVPFPPGTMILLSGKTWYSMEPLRGKGTCLLMIVDFFTES